MKSIGYYSFYRCPFLSQVTIPLSCTFICDFAFAQYISLKRITIPSSVRSIGNNVFKGCKKLKEVEIDPYITNFEQNTFSDCLLLNHFIFGSSVKAIKQFNFSLFGKITKITIPQSVVSRRFFHLKASQFHKQLTKFQKMHFTNVQILMKSPLIHTKPFLII